MSDTPDKWYLSGPLGIDVPEPPQQLSLTGGIGFANHNATDKKLYSPVDGVLEWMTHEWAGQHGLAVSHQGTQRVFLNTNGDSYLNGGKVGIGTTEPKATLHINGELRIDGARTIINGFDGANNHWIKTNTAEPASVFMTFVNTSGGDAQAVRIAPGNKGGLTVNSAGNVSIGTTDPGLYKLMVSGGDTRFAANGQKQSLFGLDRLVGLNDLRFYADDTGNTEVMHLDASGLRINGSINWSEDRSNLNYIRLGNLQICWGSGTHETDILESSEVVNFPSTYSTQSPIVIVNINDPGPTYNEFNVGVGAYQVNQTGFTALFKRAHKDRKITVTYYWVAIGSIG